MAASKKTVLITGSEGYIGQALVKSFVERGDHVIRVDLSRTSKANDELGFETTSFYEVDLGKENDIEKLWREALPQHHPRIDVLINNAASGGFRGPFHEQDPSTFDTIYQINIKAAFLMMQEAIKHMIAHKSGYIINIASTAGIRPFPTTAIYSASKAALISLTQSAAIEYAGNGLVINSISPGALERPNVKGWSEEELKNMPSRTYQNRSCRPEEVAGIALFLSSDAASHIIGHNLVVDGGGHGAQHIAKVLPRTHELFKDRLRLKKGMHYLRQQRRTAERKTPE